MLRFIVLLPFLLAITTNALLKQCAGDTRPGLDPKDDRKCNHDSTHRVCAKIGEPDTSFWHFTGQTSWCGSSYDDNANNWMSETRCPPDKPTWCICKWATEKWINGEGCDNIEIDCDATDVCNLKASYVDYDVDLANARKCIEDKCPTQWNACTIS